MFSISNLVSGYGQSQILHELNLNVAKKEIVAVMGRNGMGKTTLFKSLMGVLPQWGAALLTATIFLMLYRSRWGLQVRATMQNRVMSRAVGINTKKVDRMTFALGCGVAGVAGAAFTTIGSTGPTAGSLYIVDTFLTVVFGGAASLVGTIASAFTIAQAQSIMEFFLSGSMAKVLTLSAVILILMLRPQGLFSIKVRK